MTKIVPLTAVVTLALILGWPASPARADRAEVIDGPYDAYRLRGSFQAQRERAPRPDLSDPAADIRSVAFENVAPGRVYSVAVTLQGRPDAEHNYIPSGVFGDGCWIFHIMTPGTVARANVFCGPNHSEFTESFVGSPVEVRGTTVSATFLYQSTQLPPRIQLAEEITDLFAFTCRGIDGSRGCTGRSTLDWAEAPAATFRI